MFFPVFSREIPRFFLFFSQYFPSNTEIPGKYWQETEIPKFRENTEKKQKKQPSLRSTLMSGSQGFCNFQPDWRAPHLIALLVVEKISSKIPGLFTVQDKPRGSGQVGARPVPARESFDKFHPRPDPTRPVRSEKNHDQSTLAGHDPARALGNSSKSVCYPGTRAIDHTCDVWCGVILPHVCCHTRLMSKYMSGDASSKADGALWRVQVRVCETETL